MKILKNPQLLSFAIFTIAVSLALSGCVGKMMAANPSPPRPSASPGGNTPSNAQTITDIQTLAGWENCTVCTGSATAVYSMTEGITAPAMAGTTSARLQLLNGTLPFGGALWFKFLGAQNSATHFIFYLFIYVDKPAAAQAIEFTVNQSDGQNRYSFSTQCGLQGAHAWRNVLDPTGAKWVASAVACEQPGAGQPWNHLVWELNATQAAT